MTQDERNMLNDLANKLAKTPTPPKDPEAEEFIRTRIGSRPDALYLMTQTVLIQNLALEQAKKQIEELQQRAGQGAPAGGSFLGQQQPSSPYAGSSYAAAAAPPSSYGAPPSMQAPANPTFSGGGAPSFLRGAAQTAAGVAAGALAFEGIRSLFSHPGYGSGLGGFGGSPVEETVVNNYYDNPSSDYGTADQPTIDHGTSLADAGLEPRDTLDSQQYDNNVQDDNLVDAGDLDDASYDDGGDFGSDDSLV
jgi:hypothetical protein